LFVLTGGSPTLDMQQLATHARDASLMTADDIAISVVAEVASGKLLGVIVPLVKILTRL